MSAATLRVTHAGPLVTLQDKGRFGQLRYGVSASGPMDRLSFAAAHAALALPEDRPAIEMSLGGLVLECVEGSISVAVTGGSFSLSHRDTQTEGWQVITLSPGDRLSLRGGAWGSWCYLAFSGDLAAEEWLGSLATHSMTGFGGGALANGQTLTFRNVSALDARDGPVEAPILAKPADPIRLMIGPQDRHFAPEAVEALLDQPFTVSDAYDRMGMRLKGPALAPAGALSIPSEPILRGSVQVSGDGVPTVLLADHGTTGGYPKIATVLAEDQDRLVQLRAGQKLRFAAVSPTEAIEIARTEATERSLYLNGLRKPKASLLEKLMGENLIDGVVSARTDQ